jgi:hypothetical protein
MSLVYTFLTCRAAETPTALLPCTAGARSATHIALPATVIFGAKHWATWMPWCVASIAARFSAVLASSPCNGKASHTTKRAPLNLSEFVDG